MTKKRYLILFLACLCMTISFDMHSPVQGAPSDHPSVAIIPFDDGPIQGPNRWWDRSWEVGRGVANEFATAVAGTGKVNLIRPEQVERALAEMRLPHSRGSLPSSVAVRLGRSLGAHLIISGEVTDFSNNPSGSSKIMRRARVAVNACMIDTSNGQIIATAATNGDRLGVVYDFRKLRLGSSQFNKTNLGIALKTAVDRLAEQLLPKIPPFGGPPVPPRPDGPPVRQPEPPAAPGKPIVGKIIMVKRDQVDINVGDFERVRPGMNFKVYRIIDTVDDSSYGKVCITEPIAKITVISIQMRTATCRVYAELDKETRITENDLVRQVRD